MSQMEEGYAQKEKNAEWLPHLTSEVVADARGPNLDAYAIALEGWRRGLVLKWHTKESGEFNEMKTWFAGNPGKLFSLSSKEKTHYFFKSRGDKVTNEAVDVGADKEKTKYWLSQNDILVPEGMRFTEKDSNQVILDYISFLGYPVVIKPADGSFGRGVMTNINNDEQLERALRYIRSELNYKDIIVERYIAGDEYRIYVVGNKVVGALKRIPAHVIGDGISSLDTLIANKNEERRENPRLISCPIIVNQETMGVLEELDYTLDSIPNKDVQVFLSKKSNISLGGDPIDVLDELPLKVKKKAVLAIQSVPGLNHGAVDLILNNKKQEECTGVVLEINPTAQIGSLLFPLKGKSRDIPASIIDFYFPEAQRNNIISSKVYFDYKEALKPLTNKTAAITTVVPFPDKRGIVQAKKYEIIGTVEQPDYHRWIKEQALEHNIIGFINNCEQQAIEVVVAGSSIETLDNFKHIISSETNRAIVTEFYEENWDHPIKLGFEIEGDHKNLIYDLKKLNMKILEANKKHNKLEREHEKLLNSRTWYITKPFRYVTGNFKKAFRSLLKNNY